MIGESLRIGQPPVASELWNTRAPKTPKDEGELSNWLIRRLEAELGKEFAMTRESLLVGGEKGRGKSGDILLTFSPSQGDERLRVLIEVKGSWEEKVRSRMETQLSEEYMKKTGIDHAIYLVFWFDRSDWDPSDRHRRGRSTFGSADQARDFFGAQAGELSREGRQIEAVVIDGSLS